MVELIDIPFELFTCVGQSYCVLDLDGVETPDPTRKWTILEGHVSTYCKI